MSKEVGGLKQRQGGSGPDSGPDSGPSGLKRQAPDSSGLLKEVENATKAKQSETFEQRKRRILKQCGC